ncbi:MAG: CBS domain-containing protein [Bacillota bacterium]|nr:CBS domain-containing protein [Bacillota bacterium]
MNNNGMGKAERFIDLYNEFDGLIRKMGNFKKDDKFLEIIRKIPSLRRNYTGIKCFHEVRCLLVHNVRISEQYPVIPTDETMAFLQERIDEVKNRPRCYDIAVKKEDIFSAEMEDSVRQTVDAMRKKSFSHVPVMKDGRVVAVLSEHSIFNYVADEGIVDIDDKLIIQDLYSKNYLSLDRADVEVFCFQSSSSYVDDLLEVFEEAFEEGNRVGMVFLTQNGCRSEKLMGILTPWDVLAKSKK